jgi:hypothetical protein
LKQATEYDVVVAVFKNYTADAKWFRAGVLVQLHSFLTSTLDGGK